MPPSQMNRVRNTRWRVAACAATALTVLLAGCSSEGGETAAPDTSVTAVTEVAPLPPSTESATPESTTESTPSPSSAGSAPVAAAEVPADACALFDAAVLSALVGETVEGTIIGPGVCQFSGTDVNGMLPTVAVRQNVDGAGGLDAARTGAEGTVRDVAQPLDIDGSPGFLIVGGANGPAVGGATVHGFLITVAVVNGKPDTKAATLTSMLRTAVGQL